VLATGGDWLVEQERIGTHTEFLRDGNNPRGARVRVPAFNAVHRVLT